MRNTIGFTMMAVLNLCLIAVIFSTQSRSWFELRRGESFPSTLVYEGLGQEAPEAALGHIYLFLHADGSCDCLDDWSNWVQLFHQFSGEVTIKGVFNGVDKGKMRSFAKELQLPFRIYQDDKGILRKRYHVMPGQIVKVVLNREGHVIYSDTYQAHPSDQKYFIKRVHTLIDWMDG